MSWTLAAQVPPPQTVELDSGGVRVRYRLVRDLRRRRPARDQLGNYLYMPAL